MDKYIEKKLSILLRDDIIIGKLLSFDNKKGFMKVDTNGETVKVMYKKIKSLKLYKENEQISEKHEVILTELLEEYGPSTDSFASNCALNIYQFISKRLFIFQKIALYIGNDELGGKILFNLAFNFTCTVEIILPKRKKEVKFLDYLYFAKNRKIKIRENFDKKYDLIFISSKKNYVNLNGIRCDNFLFVSNPCTDLMHKNNFILHYNPVFQICENYQNIFIFSNFPEKVYRKYKLKRTDFNFNYLN